MQMPLSGRQAEIRGVITTFLTERRDSKLDKLLPDDPKRAELQQQFDVTTWIEDASRRVAQIQAVTHSLKPIHPDAKGTNLYIPPDSLPTHDLVGSHALGSDFSGDVVGNAAALDVHKFLKLSHDGQSLMQLVLTRDPDLAAALSDDPALADTWMAAFAGIILPRGQTASHGFAKQLYWLVGEDPCDDSGYHLLAPLYASSLAHRVFALVNEDRFSEPAKAARKARWESQFSERPVHEYTQLAVQKLGGTKPQNISQLNSERGGSNYLLASLPPSWKSRDVQPLLHTGSIFDRFEHRKSVKIIVKEMLQFLKTNPASNAQTRDQVKAMVAALLDELLEFGAEHRTLAPSWSQQPDCDLGTAEKHWLDPYGVAAAVQAGEMTQPNDSARVLSESFARWLNHQLRDPLPMGDPEDQHWRKLALIEFEAEDWEVDHVE